MDKRPDSITVIGIILIVFGCCSILSGLLLFAVKDMPQVQSILAQAQAAAPSPVPFMVNVLVGVFAGVVRLGGGILVMLRKGWAVHVLTAWAVVSLCYGFYASSAIVGLIINLVFWGLILGFLYIPANRAWFAGKNAAQG